MIPWPLHIRLYIDSGTPKLAVSPILGWSGVPPFLDNRTKSWFSQPILPVTKFANLLGPKSSQQLGNLLNDRNDRLTAMGKRHPYSGVPIMAIWIAPSDGECWPPLLLLVNTGCDSLVSF